MSIKIVKLSAEEWKLLSMDSHAVVFEEKRPPYMDRIDFAIMTVDDETETPLCYVTVRELDAETVYFQYGGAYPSAKGTSKSYESYKQLIDWTRKRYKRATNLVVNENIKMLQFCFAQGFRIIGVRTFKGQVLCELLLEFEGD